MPFIHTRSGRLGFRQGGAHRLERRRIARRPFQLAMKILRAGRQPEGFELRRAARRVLAHQHEVARIRHQHQPVAAPILTDLFSLRRQPRFVIDIPHLHHAAFWRLASPHLLRRIQAEVGIPRTLTDNFANAKTFGLSAGPTPLSRLVGGP